MAECSLVIYDSSVMPVVSTPHRCGLAQNSVDCSTACLNTETRFAHAKRVHIGTVHSTGFAFLPIGCGAPPVNIAVIWPEESWIKGGLLAPAIVTI